MSVTSHEVTDGTVTVNTTEEGVIIDAFADGQCVGTIGMTFEEWFDLLDNRETP